MSRVSVLCMGTYLQNQLLRDILGVLTGLRNDFRHALEHFGVHFEAAALVGTVFMALVLRVASAC